MLAWRRGGVARERALDHEREVGGDGRSQRAQRRRLGLLGRGHGGALGLALERVLQREALVGHDPEGELVAARVGAGLVAADLLGCEVGRRADQVLGQADARVLVGARVVGQAEVDQPGRALGVEEHVVGLDVAVQDAPVVAGGERVGQLAQHGHARGERAQAFGQGHDLALGRGWLAARVARELIDHLPQRGPGDELHGEVGVRARLADLVHLDHVRMLELRQRARLVQHPGAVLLVEQAVGVQDLERNAPAHVGVVGEVHDADAALAEQPEDPEAADALGGRLRSAGGGLVGRQGAQLALELHAREQLRGELGGARQELLFAVLATVDRREVLAEQGLDPLLARAGVGVSGGGAIHARSLIVRAEGSGTSGESSRLAAARSSARRRSATTCAPLPRGKGETGLHALDRRSAARVETRRPISRSSHRAPRPRPCPGARSRWRSSRGWCRRPPSGFHPTPASSPWPSNSPACGSRRGRRACHAR